MSQSVGEIIYLALDRHPPQAVNGQRVTCKCGWRGERYLEHLAEVADRDLAASRHTLTDGEGRQVRTDFPGGTRKA
jgi:hypothetical protein